MRALIICIALVHSTLSLDRVKRQVVQTSQESSTPGTWSQSWSVEPSLQLGVGGLGQGEIESYVAGRPLIWGPPPPPPVWTDGVWSQAQQAGGPWVIRLGNQYPGQLGRIGPQYGSQYELGTQRETVPLAMQFGMGGAGSVPLDFGAQLNGGQAGSQLTGQYVQSAQSRSQLAQQRPARISSNDEQLGRQARFEQWSQGGQGGQGFMGTQTGAQLGGGPMGQLGGQLVQMGQQTAEQRLAQGNDQQQGQQTRFEWNQAGRPGQMGVQSDISIQGAGEQTVVPTVQRTAQVQIGQQKTRLGPRLGRMEAQINRPEQQAGDGMFGIQLTGERGADRPGPMGRFSMMSNGVPAGESGQMVTQMNLEGQQTGEQGRLQQVIQKQMGQSGRMTGRFGARQRLAEQRQAEQGNNQQSGQQTRFEQWSQVGGSGGRLGGQGGDTKVEVRLTGGADRPAPMGRFSMMSNGLMDGDFSVVAGSQPSEEFLQRQMLLLPTNMQSAITQMTTQQLGSELGLTTQDWIRLLEPIIRMVTNGTVDVPVTTIITTGETNANDNVNAAPESDEDSSDSDE